MVVVEVEAWHRANACGMRFHSLMSLKLLSLLPSLYPSHQLPESQSTDCFFFYSRDEGYSIPHQQGFLLFLKMWHVSFTTGICGFYFKFVAAQEKPWDSPNLFLYTLAMCPNFLQDLYSQS